MDQGRAQFKVMLYVRGRVCEQKRQDTSSYDDQLSVAFTYILVLD